MAPPVCLTIGGSDSCAGAGIQADLQIFTRYGIRGCSAITALTAQNPAAITHVEPVSIAHLEAELCAVFDYYDVAAVKTGMMVDAGHVGCVSRMLAGRHPNKPLVIDPVMVSSSGTVLLDDGGRQAMVNELFPMATLITPNLPEAELLLGLAITDPVEAASAMAMLYRTSVLLKGGHRAGEMLTDVLVSQDGDIQLFSHPRQSWNEEQAHGTGCRLAAGIAALLARGESLAGAAGMAAENTASFDKYM